MTMEYKTITRDVQKVVTVQEKTEIVVHTLPNSSDPTTAMKDSLTKGEKAKLDAILTEQSPLRAFMWEDTAEGYDFWYDVAYRLNRLADRK